MYMSLLTTEIYNTQWLNLYRQCRIWQSKEAGIRTLVALDDQGGKKLKQKLILELHTPV